MDFKVKVISHTFLNIYEKPWIFKEFLRPPPLQGYEKGGRIGLLRIIDKAEESVSRDIPWQEP